MESYQRDYFRELLSKIFEENSVSTVLSWLIGNESRKPVVVVGAGFTRNAETKEGHRVSTQEIPLWGDVLKQLAMDLDLSQSGSHDPLTLAQMHWDELGESAFYNKLLGLVDDNALRPGEAHEALFDYPSEAIITTNQLDTVLDHNNDRLIRVVVDPDLAIHRRYRRNKQLIYFHGHRSQRSTWVFTRNQYEDLLRSRPAMVTRVRQLLTMFPVLLVGYSLDDPDFHHIYRQLSLDMTNNHPTGLCIMLPDSQKQNPPAPIRRHWEKLGIRIAVLRSDRDPSACLTDFFRKINPGPMQPSASLEKVVEDVLAIPTLSLRLQYVASILRDDLHHFESTRIRSRRAQDRELWESVALGELTVEERKKVARPHEDDEFVHLPSKRFLSHERIPRLVDQLYVKYAAAIEKSPVALQEISQWLQLAFDEIFAQHGTFEDLVLVDLLSWHWSNIAIRARSTPFGSHLLKSARRTISTCLEVVTRYPFNPFRGHIVADAESLDIPIEPVPTAYRDAMNNGFIHALNGRYQEATDSYKSAWEVAARDGDPFLEWLAVDGILRYHGQDDERRDEAARRGYEERRAELLKLRVIADFLKLTEQREQQLASVTHEEALAYRDKLLFGSRSHSYHSYASQQLSTFMEYHYNHAAPHRQKGAIEPLLSYCELVVRGSHVPLDVPEQLRHRICFETKGTDKWLQALLEGRAASIEAQTERDLAIVQEIMKTDVSNTELIGQLKLIPKIRAILQKDSHKLIVGLLAACHARLGMSAKSFRSETYLDTYYAKAWFTYACTQSAQLGLSSLSTYARKLEHPIEAASLLGTLGKLPWARWRMQAGDNAISLIELALGVLADLDRVPDKILYQHAGAAAAIELALGDSKTLPEQPTHTLVREWVQGMLQREPENELAREGLRQLRRIALRVYATEARHAVAVNAVTEYMGLLEGTEADRSVSIMDDVAACIGDLLGAGCQSEVDLLIARWLDVWRNQADKILKFLTSNPHYAGQHAYAFSMILKTEPVGSERASIVRKLTVQLVGVLPRVASFLAELLDPQIWAESWDDLLSKLITMTDDLSQAGTIALLDLLERVYYPPGEARERLAPELQPLLDYAIFQAVSTRRIVASHAALVAVRYARFTVDAVESRRLCAILTKIAEDPRPPVRMLGAFGAAHLSRAAASEEIRSVASKLDAALEDDPYIAVQNERLSGRLMAERGDARSASPAKDVPEDRPEPTS